jgi:hypothetical protein
VLPDRAQLVKSWLATLHGPGLRLRPPAVGSLPAWRTLLRTAAAWHVAYALVAYAGALVIARSGSTNLVAVAIRGGGTMATLLAALGIWWGGVGLSTVLWWARVRGRRR